MAPRVGDETIRNFSGPPTGDPLLGTIVDSYRVESVIGSGAMGIVYRAVHTVIGKPVAIKVLKADFSDDPEMVQRLVREARTVNAIRHPSIVDAFGFGTLPRTGQPYIVMDLLVGEPLDAYVQREAPMSLKATGRILDELLSGLWAAHQVGVIHRDLKPGNCFLEALPDGSNRLKLLDFGLARQADRAGGSVRPTNPGTLIGTPAFMAPEQVMGQKTGPATDLYAVGGMAYLMLTGHLPHEAPSAIEVLTQKMQFDPVRPRQWNPWVSEELDAWVMSLLDRDPDQRPRDAETARRSLRRLVDGRTLAENPAYTPSSPSGVKGPSSPSGLRAPSSPSGLRSRNTPPPKREWGESRTLLVENAPPAKATESMHSPWAKTSPLPGVETGAEPTAREAPSPLSSQALASRIAAEEDVMGEEATLLRTGGTAAPTPVAAASHPPAHPAPHVQVPHASSRTPAPQARMVPSVALPTPDPSSSPTARVLAPAPQPMAPQPAARRVPTLSPRDEVRTNPSEPRVLVPGVPRSLLVALVVVTGIVLVFLALIFLQWKPGR